MLTKKQVEDTIEGLQLAVEDNARAIISALKSGQNGVHRIISQAPSLNFSLSALNQMQTLLVDMEDAEEEFIEAKSEASNPDAVELENPFAKRMREAREAKLTTKKR